MDLKTSLIAKLKTFESDYLVFVYAFYKKSQEYIERDKELIRNRIARIEI